MGYLPANWKESKFEAITKDGVIIAVFDKYKKAMEFKSLHPEYIVRRVKKNGLI